MSSLTLEAFLRMVAIPKDATFVAFPFCLARVSIDWTPTLRRASLYGIIWIGDGVPYLPPSPCVRSTKNTLTFGCSLVLPPAVP